MKAVTDAQVAVLRAQLSSDTRERGTLLGQLDREADRAGYTALVAAGFFEAVDRRFDAKSATADDVIEYVSELRVRSPQVAEDLDPSAAERLIRHMLGHPVSVSDLDAGTKFGIQIIVLAGLIADEELDDAGLDSFLADVRAIAEGWTN